MITLAGTGHRPDKLGGYDPLVTKRVNEFAIRALRHYQPSTVISGMAQGWDMALAQAAVTLGIPFHAYVPFEGQELVWPSATRLYYKALLEQAQHVVICSPGGYSPAAMQRRNIQMVNACDFLLALWDGSPGGTANCINYAQFMNRPMFNAWGLFTTEGDFDVQEDAMHDRDHARPAGPDWLED